MDRKIVIFITIISLIIAACSSREQQQYEDLLEKAKEKIIEEQFNVAYNLLIETIDIPYENNEEAKNLHKQLKLYMQLEDLMEDGNFEDVYKNIEIITTIEYGSSIIKDKAETLKKQTQKDEKRYNKLTETVDDALKLVENKEYVKANKELEKIDLDQYNKKYYSSVKKTIDETITSNDKQIKIEQEEKKKQEGAERKNNMLNWSDEEVKQFIVNYIGMDEEHLLIDIYDRTESSYRIEVRQHNAAMGVGDPNVAPALGFFEVRSDGKLYEQDRMTGEYERVD